MQEDLHTRKTKLNPKAHPSLPLLILQEATSAHLPHLPLECGHKREWPAAPRCLRAAAAFVHNRWKLLQLDHRGARRPSRARRSCRRHPPDPLRSRGSRREAGEPGKPGMCETVMQLAAAAGNVWLQRHACVWRRDGVPRIFVRHRHGERKCVQCGRPMAAGRRVPWCRCAATAAPADAGIPCLCAAAADATVMRCDTAAVVAAILPLRCAAAAVAAILPLLCAAAAVAAVLPLRCAAATVAAVLPLRCAAAAGATVLPLRCAAAAIAGVLSLRCAAAAVAAVLLLRCDACAADAVLRFRCAAPAAVLPLRCIVAAAAILPLRCAASVATISFLLTLLLLTRYSRRSHGRAQ
eukprot:41418-Chlamydomonas_euryale.AAC.2